jgi:pilus assembly protein CpaE
MTGDLAAFHSLTREIGVVSPDTVLVAVYRPDSFSDEVWDDSTSGTIFVQAIRAGVRDVLRRPVSRSDLQQLFERLGNNSSSQTSTSAQLGTIVSMISNKGGVGKSTTAVNVAVGLAQRHPRRVLLVDCSLQMGVCAAMLDLKPKTSILDVAREQQRLDETLVRQLALPHRSGVDLLAAPPDAIAATEIDDEMISRVLTLARRSYDYVIVDTFPLFDRVVMAVLDLSDLVYIVLDNVVPTILSVAELIRLLDNLEYSPENQRVILNRFSRIAGSPSQDDVASQLRRPVAHMMPLDNRAITSANIGEPFALRPRRWSKLDRGLKGIVDEIESLRLDRRGSKSDDNRASNDGGKSSNTDVAATTRSRAASASEFFPSSPRQKNDHVPNASREKLTEALYPAEHAVDPRLPNDEVNDDRS